MTMVHIYITQFKTLLFNPFYSLAHSIMEWDTLYQQLMSSSDNQNYTMNPRSYKIISMLHKLINSVTWQDNTFLYNNSRKKKTIQCLQNSSCRSSRIQVINAVTDKNSIHCDNTVNIVCKAKYTIIILPFLYNWQTSR